MAVKGDRSIVPEIKELVDPIAQPLQSAKLPRLKRVVLLSKTPRPGMLLYAQVVALGQHISDEALQERRASGTTGFPKGAMLTHYNLVNQWLCAGLNQDYSQERYVNPMPLFHIAGSNFVIASVMDGMTLIQLILLLLTRRRYSFTTSRRSHRNRCSCKSRCLLRVLRRLPLSVTTSSQACCL
jgi:acyl-CoA synthetase (AMP-forming)/AMP-acid ligase II